MRSLCVTAVAVVSIGSLWGGPITVDTTASTTASYSTYSQTTGPFPWSDLGITAGASISAGTLNVATGGATSYALQTTITGGETFTHFCSPACRRALERVQDRERHWKQARDVIRRY